MTTPRTTNAGVKQFGGYYVRRKNNSSRGRDRDCHGVVVGAARADTYLFTDALRHGRVARSEAAFHADEHRCGADANDHFHNVATFKKCMRAHGWVADAYKPDAPKSPRADSHLAPGDDYISSDTGMSCKDLGGIGICGAPRGTVHYRNESGENCTRTGLVSICD
jgi:hypothetical protein